MEGNERRRQLAKVLHATLSAAPVTAERLAKMFSVSVRTVRYDLDALAEEMRSEGLCIRTQARRGIWLERVESVQETVTPASALDRKERRDRIILALLGSAPCSIDGIAEELAISRNTLISDLKDVQATLEQRGLIYVSKRGAGISATGGEQEIRDMLIHIFAKEEHDFRHFDRADGAEADSPFRRYAEALPMAEIAAFFLDLLRRHGVLGSDLSINRMICALAVQLRRLREGHAITEERPVDFLSNEGEATEGLAAKIASGMADYAPEFLRPAEVQHIVKELLHSRIYVSHEGMERSQETALALAREFVEYAQVWLGDTYADDEELLRNLAVHLRPALERAHVGIVLTNPLLGRIREQYRSIFLIAARAAEQLGARMNLHFSEDEIGYLTLYLGAAIERKKRRRTRKLPVVLICGNGVGTATLLAHTIRNRLPNLHIVRILSYYNMRAEDLEGVDVVISTVPVELPDKAVLRISPILTDAEIEVIEGQLQYLYDSRFIMTENAVHEPRGMRLTELLTEEMIALDMAAEDWTAAVRSAGLLLCAAGAVEDRYVERMVASVRELGAYIVVCPGVAMPHARPSDGVRRLATSFVRLTHPVPFAERDGAEADLIFAFATPDEKAHEELLLDLWAVFSDAETLGELRDCTGAAEVRTVIERCTAARKE